ncbi:hypothetical protein PanWU01x14_019610, partial [Parasponia andersonii]
MFLFSLIHGSILTPESNGIEIKLGDSLAFMETWIHSSDTILGHYSNDWVREPLSRGSVQGTSMRYCRIMKSLVAPIVGSVLHQSSTCHELLMLDSPTVHVPLLLHKS